MFVALNVVGIALLVSSLVLTVTSIVTANSNEKLSRKTDIWGQPLMLLGVALVMLSILLHP